MKVYTVGILTVSDRSYRGERVDTTGPKIVEYITSQSHPKHHYKVIKAEIVPDEMDKIQEKLIEWCDQLKINLILTTGGTGFSKRDRTPEAIKQVIDKEAIGITLAMLKGSLEITSMAMLSRPICGSRNQSLIISLPGSSKGSLENLSMVFSTLFHALELLSGDDGEVFHKKMNCMCEKEEEREGKSLENIEEKQSQKEGDKVGELKPQNRESPFPMIKTEEAINIIKKECQNIFKKETEIISIGKSMLGKVVAEDILSEINIPPYKASVVDGYCMNYNEFEGVYEVLEKSSTAGDQVEVQLNKNQVVKIATGGKLVDNSNKVVMIEDTEVLEFDNREIKIKVNKRVEEGTFVREIGSDLKKGQILLEKYQIINESNFPSILGLLSSANIQKIKVFKTPIVGVFSSGNELIDIHSVTNDTTLIRDANRPSLISACEKMGLKVVDFGIIKDDYNLTQNKLIEAIEQVDIIITSGAVSMGEKDYIKPILNNHPNFDLKFGRLFMKPGKPATFATYKKEKLIFALPGNPVSAMVTFQLLVLPALNYLSGNWNFKFQKIQVELEHSIRLDPRPEYHRCIIKYQNNQLKASSIGNQDSSRLLSMLNANALLILPEKKEDKIQLNPGELVEALLLGTIQ
ncbi:Molybdopterin binding protein [Neoconidiobolus thromboides FSU 785]|nr:Molybdopterin binding protein [Neoconidiobolus thromboides FSU 785]